MEGFHGVHAFVFYDVLSFCPDHCCCLVYLREARRTGTQRPLWVWAVLFSMRFAFLSLSYKLGRHSQQNPPATFIRFRRMLFQRGHHIIQDTRSGQCSRGKFITQASRQMLHYVFVTFFLKSRAPSGGTRMELTDVKYIRDSTSLRTQPEGGPLAQQGVLGTFFVT